MKTSWVATQLQFLPKTREIDFATKVFFRHETWLSLMFGLFFAFTVHQDFQEHHSRWMVNYCAVNN